MTAENDTRISTMDELVSIIGQAATAQLVARFGGHPLRFGKRSYAGSALQKSMRLAVGQKAAETLHQYYLGQTVYIPKNEHDTRRKYAEEVARMSAEGYTPAEISRMLTVTVRKSERTIYRLLSVKTKEMQNELF